MYRRAAIVAVATSVVVGVAIAVQAVRLSGAFDQIEVAAERSSEGFATRAAAVAGESTAVTATAIATPTVSVSASVAAAAIAPDSPDPAAVTSSPSPVDAYLATRADLERRAAAGATLPNGAELSPADIAGLLAKDPQFQSALLDLARDADPEFRREAAQFLAGIENGGETGAPE